MLAGALFIVCFAVVFGTEPKSIEVVTLPREVLLGKFGSKVHKQNIETIVKSNSAGCDVKIVYVSSNINLNYTAEFEEGGRNGVRYCFRVGKGCSNFTREIFESIKAPVVVQEVQVEISKCDNSEKNRLLDTLKQAILNESHQATVTATTAIEITAKTSIGPRSTTSVDGHDGRTDTRRPANLNHGKGKTTVTPTIGATSTMTITRKATIPPGSTTSMSGRNVTVSQRSTSRKPEKAEGNDTRTTGEILFLRVF